MRFFKEVINILEAYKEPKRKDVARGAKMYSTQHQEGPTGLAKGTVGVSEFGHFTPKDFTKNPLADTKARSVIKTEVILRNIFRILKSNPVFREKINTLLTKYSKTRKQIRHDQEHVLSYNPGKIDNLFIEIMRLEKIITALGPRDRRTNEFVTELRGAKEKYNEYSLELEQVYDQMSDTINQNEQSSLEYQDKVIELCQKIGKKEFNKIVDEMGTDENNIKNLKTFEEIADVLISYEDFDDDVVRLEHLNLILSDNEEVNPLYTFFHLYNGKYNETKGTDENFKKLVYETQNISVETLWNRLPMSAFSYFYNTTKDDQPLRKLTKGKLRQIKSFQPIKDVLNMITSEDEYEKYRENLREMLDNMDIDQGRRKAIDEILSGPYKRRGATAVQRLLGLLRGVLRENCDIDIQSDKMYLDILSKYSAY